MPTLITGPVVCFQHYQPSSLLPSTLDAKQGAVAAGSWALASLSPFNTTDFTSMGATPLGPNKLEDFLEAVNRERAFATAALAPDDALDA